MRIRLDCRPTWFGSWRVDLERDLVNRQWSLRATRDPPPYGPVAGPDAIEPTTRSTASPGRTRPVGQVQIERMLTRSEVAWLEQCLKVDIPLSPPMASGLDGTRWRLDIEYGFNAARFEWWPQLPRSWRAIGPLINLLAELAELPADFPYRPRVSSPPAKPSDPPRAPPPPAP